MALAIGGEVFTEPCDGSKLEFEGMARENGNPLDGGEWEAGRVVRRSGRRGLRRSQNRCLALPLV